MIGRSLGRGAGLIDACSYRGLYRLLGAFEVRVYEIDAHSWSMDDRVGRPRFPRLASASGQPRAKLEEAIIYVSFRFGWPSSGAFCSFQFYCIETPVSEAHFSKGRYEPRRVHFNSFDFVSLLELAFASVHV